MIDNKILEKNKISDDIKENIKKYVATIILNGKQPVKNPVCVITGGQSGSGKSALMAYSSKMFPDENVIILEDDALRAYYPGAEKISVQHPNEYIKITNELTNELTSYLLKLIAENHYNLIFHQTLKNTRIADDGIVMLKNNGYSVVVRGLAVSCLESRMSMIERCLGQIEKNGFCRNVTTADHDKTYYGMPSTIDYIEKNGRYDVLEIFRRGESVKLPKLIYSRVNPNSNAEVENIATHPEVSTQNVLTYQSGMEAVDMGRKINAKEFLKTAKERIEKAESSKFMTPFLSEQLMELKQMMGSDYSSENFKK